MLVISQIALNHVFFLRSSYLLISTIIFSNYLQMTHFKNHAEPERNGSLLNLLMKSTPQVSNYLFFILKFWQENLIFTV